MTSRISRCRCRLRRCQVTRKTKGDTKVPRGTLYINIENAMACVPYSLTHAHVTTVAPPRLRSKGLHPSSHAHRVPGSRLRDYEATRLRDHDCHFHHLTLLGTRLCILWCAAAGATSAPYESPTATARSIGACWLSGLTGSMRCPKPRSGPRRRSGYCDGPDVHSSLEPKSPLRIAPVHPACRPSAHCHAALPSMPVLHPSS